jgi:Zn-dependent peptidase ImmA (M78 family)/DNA-binding XRE family transcriptional regulator
MINGLRLRQVRELYGLTQSELAERLDVNQSTVAYIEGGFSQPSEDLLAKICKETGFPAKFFERMEVTDFPLGSLLYRSRTTLDAVEKAKANRYGQFMFEMAEHLSKPFNIKYFRQSRLKDPIVAAQMTRSELGLSPDRPIDHLVFEFERNGVLVFNTPESVEKVDAYSAWAGTYEKKPVIVLTNNRAGDRMRFTIAHELGHLVMHSMIFGDLQEFEREADRFAAELLMPEAAMRDLIVQPFTLYDAIKLRDHWKVSIQALLHRVYELQIINERQYKNLIVQLSRLKAKLPELDGSQIPIERPRTLKRLAELLYGKKSGNKVTIDYKQFSQEINLPVDFLRNIIEAQAGQAEYTRNDASKREGKVLEFRNDRSSGGPLAEKDLGAWEG